ncbi:SURF1 family protein [Microbulbifer sp. YPW1]|uniref:SURF1 family protein n=1 Tax=Microbulbifer sp. YPW1 TaxID=2745199 RepID=UPI001599894D|nr:SURF1 family protein [Microbulbifer sp. YPW1]QKX16626.1 SURF1 family protein [Microbulbifer sp. YPW1]
MTVPKMSPEEGGNALTSGTRSDSKEAGEPSRAASVAFIRSWPLSLLCLCFFPLLLGLGNWQLQRAAEKQILLDRIDGRLSAQPQSIDQLHEPQSYTPVRLLGFYTDEYFYLDNRTRNGRVGYEILQVFETGDRERGKRRWLINRGWLPASSQRSELPEVAYPLAAKVITGFIYPSGNQVGRESNDAPSRTTPHARIQSLYNIAESGLRLDYPQWHIRLSADSDTALFTDWQLVNTNPQRHRGYAVQWFSMAAALCLLWLLAATNIREMVRQKWFKKPTKQT